jgi:TatD DNase family protein
MSQQPGWTDTHCHIQETYLEDPAGVDAVVDRAISAGVARLVCVGTGAEASKQALSLAERLATGPRQALVWATVGLHPHEASDGTEGVTKVLTENAPRSGERPPGSIVAVGECGLDYFYEHSPRHAQRRAFSEQIALAKLLDLALVVHTRDAWDDTVDLLSEAGMPDRTVIHCFTGGPVEAERFLDLGAYLSFSGIVTFKNAANIREAAVACPLDRMLIETDAPFLAPVPHRGRPNEPAYAAIVGEALAKLRDLSPEALAAATTSNAAMLFGFDG